MDDRVEDSLEFEYHRSKVRRVIRFLNYVLTSVLQLNSLPHNLEVVGSGGSISYQDLIGSVIASNIQTSLFPQVPLFSDSWLMPALLN